MLFVLLLQAGARTVLSRPILEPPYQLGASKLMLSAEKMHSLYAYFTSIPDPWGQACPEPVEGLLGPKGRERFRCRYVIDWNYHEDLCRIRTGHGPVNITRLRRRPHQIQGC
jgi:hypothetical protein